MMEAIDGDVSPKRGPPFPEVSTLTQPHHNKKKKCPLPDTSSVWILWIPYLVPVFPKPLIPCLLWGFSVDFVEILPGTYPLLALLSFYVELDIA